MHDLVERLRNEDYRIASQLTFSRPMYTESDVRCALSEEAVFRVLESYGFQKHYPENKEGLSWERNDRGIVVKKGKYQETKNEFDELGFIGELPLAIEIKSTRLNKYARKISRVQKYAQKAFTKKPEILVFFSARYSRRQEINALKRASHVHPIDTGWTRKEYKKAISYSSFSH